MDSDKAQVFPFPTAEHHDKLPEMAERPVEQAPTESALDHGIEESFPASDPVSVNVSKVKHAPVAPVTSPDANASGKPGAESRSLKNPLTWVYAAAAVGAAVVYAATRRKRLY